MRKTEYVSGSIQSSLFPRSLFIIYLLTLLVTAGVHVGLIVLFQAIALGSIWQTHIILLTHK